MLPLFKAGISFHSVLFSCNLGTYYTISRGPDRVSGFIYLSLFFAGAYVVPYGILMVTNIWMLCIMKRSISKGYHREVLNNSGPGRRFSLVAQLEDKHKRNQLRLMHLFCALFCSKFFIWFPTLLTLILFPVIPAGFVTFSHVCLLFQVIVQPILQVFLLKDVRVVIMRLFKHCKFNPFFFFGNSQLGDESGSSLSSEGCSWHADHVEHCLCCCGMLDKCGAAIIGYHSALTHSQSSNETGIYNFHQSPIS